MSKVPLDPTTALYPTPVVLLTSGEIGREINVMTAAWTGIVCSDPPMVSVSVRPHRHSHRIIARAKEFVLAIPTEDMLEATDRCGVISGRDHDKFKEVGLTAVPATKVRAPLIEECPVCLECEVRDVLKLGAHDMFIGEVVAVDVSDEILVEGVIDVEKAKPILYCPVDSSYWSIGSKIGTYAFTSKKDS